MSSDQLLGRFTIGNLIDMGAIRAHKDGNFGSLYPRIEDFVKDGYPLLTAKVVNDGRIDFDAAQKLNKDKAALLKYGFIQPNDVLLSHNATVGRVAVVPNFHGRALIGTSLTYFRLDESKLLPRYLAAFFEGRDFQNQLSAVMGLSTRNQVPITAQRLLEVEVPALQDQQKISDFVGALDDRITLLRETNATLEAIAQALFKSWFVDFDPVRAKMEGHVPEGMDEATAALFPDSFEETELGEVPRGWAVGSLNQLMSLHRGTVNPGLSPDTTFQHFSLPAFDEGQMPVVELGSAIKSNKTTVPIDAVLLSKLNPHIPRIWLPSNIGGNAVCSTEFLPFVPRGSGTTTFIYCMLAAPDFSKTLAQLVTGTSNSHQRIKPDAVLLLTSVIPSPDAIAAFVKVSGALFDSLKANREEVVSLANLRDSLLPRLISGQLRLPETQAQMKEALV